MAKRRDDLSDSLQGDEPRTGSLGMKLVLFGALLPVFLGALLVSGFLLARDPGEGARTVATAEAPLDCSSARDAWRSPCLKAGAEGPATTGSVEPKAVTGRSSSVRTEASDAPNEPAKPAAAPIANPSAKPPVPPARPAARDAVAEAPKPAPAAPRATVAPPEEPVPPVKSRVAAAPEPAPAKAPAPAAENGPAAKPRPAAERSAAVPPEEPVPPVKSPRGAPEPAAKATAALVPPPEPAPAVDEKTIATPAAKPEGAKSASTGASTAASASPPAPEPAAPERRRDVERTASVPASPAVRERARPGAVEDDDEPARPARLSRHRAKAKEAARTVAAARSKAVKRERVRMARERVRVREAPDFDGGYGSLRVTSQQIHVLPDGRRIVVQARPRPEDVRELMAEHRARFGGQRRVASPVWGAPAYGGGWYAGAADW
ncbi:MAG TPA: hypothetical protein VF744_10420 [Beijerinckiaceae bacterium]|jgi:hypothetical protein